MKIDLHCHTKKTKSGDGRERNVTPTLFKDKIELADVKIVAITNHNAFDYNQYMELEEAVSGLCRLDEAEAADRRNRRANLGGVRAFYACRQV